MQQNFYYYLQRRLAVLLMWGLGSVLTGLLPLRSRNAFWRQFGLQACAWGAIDAAIALFGLRSARKKAVQRLEGTLDRADEQREARNFRRILLINTALDGGYMLAGAWITQRFQQPARRGMGAGIILQGAWLFLYDGLLAREIGQHLK